MSKSKIQEAVVVPEKEMAVVRREVTPLSTTQVQAGLKAIHDVMRDCMKDGQDFGKVPGCGEKPGLFQPGAQKLSMMFQLNPEVREEVVTDYPNNHRGYRLIVRVTNGGKFADGVGERSTLESKFRYRTQNKKCPVCGAEAVLKSKKQGEGWFCWTKKGGCGLQFAVGSPDEKKILDQPIGKVEHDNPPDFWNTVRKMAFKCAFVHAIINATNTSELWSQDLEDLRDNGVVGEPDPPPPQKTTPTVNVRPNQPQEQARPSGEPIKWREFRVPFGKNKDKQLGELEEISLLWYYENFHVESSYTGKDMKVYQKKPESIAKDQLFRDALEAAYAEMLNSGAFDRGDDVQM
jgi:hypothetical protein